MKKVVVFGSTGMTGLCAMEGCLRKGIEVRAFVRDPSKFPVELKDKVEVFKGDVLEPDSVFQAVEGTDGVIIALGTRGSLKPTSDMSEGTKNIIEAMKAKYVENVTACLSAFLFYDPEEVPPRFVDITKDHKRMFEELQQSGLNWVAVFAPHIADCPSREVIIEVNPDKSPGRSISMYDLGKFLVEGLTNTKYHRSIIGLCNAPQQ